MKTLLGIFLTAIIVLLTFSYLDTKKDPYEVGAHLDYDVKSINGFIYMSADRGYVQVLNSDGTPLKKGRKIY
jgi:hypothetical protein